MTDVATLTPDEARRLMPELTAAALGGRNVHDALLRAGLIDVYCGCGPHRETCPNSGHHRAMDWHWNLMCSLSEHKPAEVTVTDAIRECRNIMEAA